MKQNPNTKVEKRRPGRPAGTTKTLSADTALMRRAAAAMVREKHLKFSTALRDLGVVENKDLARLRKRWKLVGDTYLVNARAEIRANQTIGENLADLLPIAEIFEFVQTMEQTLTDNCFVPRLHEIVQRANSVRRDREAIQAPFDPKDLDVVVAEIVRMEVRDRRIDTALDEKNTTNEPLSDAEQMYLMAVALHAMALNQFEVDKQNDKD